LIIRSWWKDLILVLVSQNRHCVGTDVTLKTVCSQLLLGINCPFLALCVMVSHKDLYIIYIAIHPANQALSLTALQNCIEDVIQWIT